MMGGFYAHVGEPVGWGEGLFAFMLRHACGCGARFASIAPKELRVKVKSPSPQATGFLGV